jgi:GNAT superfamily N-acetyltransferase
MTSPMVSVRPEDLDDWEFVVGLYSAVRAEELAPVPWPEEAKQAFLRSQCELQRDHYVRHYPGAQFFIVESDDRPIGRMYVYVTPAEVRLMEIALIHAERGKGIGRSLIEGVLESATASQLPVTLHVEPNNPANRIYARMGFRLLEDRGVYHFLGWDPPGTEARGYSMIKP